MVENKERRKHKRGVYLGSACIIVVICLIAAYLGIGYYYTSHIWGNVTINGMNVSGMTASQIKEELINKANDYSLLIKERDGSEETIEGKDFGLQYYYDETLDDLLANQQIWAWGIHLFKPTEYKVEMTARYDSEKLKSLVNNLECMDTAKMESPTDAYLEYDEEKGLSIIPDNKGTKINKTEMNNAIISAVESAQYEISLEDAGVYVSPKVTSDDEQLNNSYNQMKKYLEMVITYHFDDEKEVLDKTIFYDWIIQKKDGTIDFDQDMISDYVKSLASKHNTAYRKHELETSYGKTITITDGSYGWIIDRATECEELYEVLKAGESQDREPVYSQTAASHTGNDYGDTYVEINLSAQHLFFYVDGELLVESDFVSGNASRGWSTPGGIFPLTYKERNATLRGENYATPVSYWMPFNGNIGMHDSTWRSSYGKNIYKTNGSHGCINLPPSVAEVIFDNIEQGMPVLCYYLSGTEYVSNEPETVTEPTTTVDATTVDAATVDSGIDEAVSQEIPAIADQTVTDAEQMQ
jgi:lipoprotein-anchoring transpeptidase ErfK/SrfK